jgi:phosphatidylserine/phosphatidylglycerophosphate/cardiolipin synthase-like enzyme
MKKIYFLLFFIILSPQCFSKNNAVFVEPDAGPQPLVKALNAAQNTIELSIYQFLSPTENADSNRVLQALAKAQARGIDVSIIMNTFNRDFPTQGKQIFQAERSWCYAHQIHCYPSSEAFTWTHNKYLIIDKKKLYLMTMNLSASDFKGHARNFIVEDFNTEDILAAKKLFATDLDNIINHSRNSPENLPRYMIYDPMRSLEQIVYFIQTAKSSLDIYAMYFNRSFENCPQAIYDAIHAAANRGLEVRILTNASDQTEKVLQQLKNHSPHINIALINEHDPHFFMHAKAFIIDDKWVLTGSHNLSYTSLRKNRELSIAFSDPLVVNAFKIQFNKDFESFYQTHDFNKDEN